ncbi:hypothetical protein BDF20DRAFT_817930, partial [Mycotypha africana]|uniref:uncharacterized protein n=1 Tax=Mycotypha africana TaxID=64632 RepID=UPI002300DC29
VRKIPLDRAVLPQFREKFKEKVISYCKDIRAIVFRCQLFANAYLVHNKNDIPSKVFTQQFWYSIAQLITGKKVNHKKALNDSIKTYFDDFKQKHPTIVISHGFTKGYSHYLKEAAKEISVSYTNSIIELFEKRMLKYLTYKLQNMFVNMKKVDAAKISEAYCYQVICKGGPKWLDKIILNNEDKSKIEMLCKSFEKLVTEKVTLLSLSSDPTKFIKALWHIQSSYEKEHDEHAAYDVRRLPLPKRFFPFPLPSLHWRFITISINSLVPFLFPGTPPKGYLNQLEKFHQVFSFKTMGTKR